MPMMLSTVRQGACVSFSRSAGPVASTTIDLYAVYILRRPPSLEGAAETFSYTELLVQKSWALGVCVHPSSLEHSRPFPLQHSTARAGLLPRQPGLVASPSDLSSCERNPLGLSSAIVRVPSSILFFESFKVPRVRLYLVEKCFDCE